MEFCERERGRERKWRAVMLGKEKLVRHDLDTSAYGKRADDVVRLGWGVFGFGQGVLEGILNCYYFDPMG